MARQAKVVKGSIDYNTRGACGAWRPVRQTGFLEIPRKTPPAPEAAWVGLTRGSDALPKRAAGLLVLAKDYRTGEKAAGISSLFSCRIGRTPAWGGHAPPPVRACSRMRARSLRSLYTQVWTNLFSPPSSLDQQAASGENFSRSGMALAHASSTFAMSPGA